MYIQTFPEEHTEAFCTRGQHTFIPNTYNDTTGNDTQQGEWAYNHVQVPLAEAEQNIFCSSRDTGIHSEAYDTRPLRESNDGVSILHDISLQQYIQLPTSFAQHQYVGPVPTAYTSMTATLNVIALLVFMPMMMLTCVPADL
jgi:hypothetical protein